MECKTVFTFYLQYNYSQYNYNITVQESIEIYIFPAVWATGMGLTVKQPIRAELNIIIHDPSK